MRYAAALASRVPAGIGIVGAPAEAARTSESTQPASAAWPSTSSANNRTKRGSSLSDGGRTRVIPASFAAFCASMSMSKSRLVNAPLWEGVGSLVRSSTPFAWHARRFAPVPYAASPTSSAGLTLFASVWSMRSILPKN